VKVAGQQRVRRDRHSCLEINGARGTRQTRIRVIRREDRYTVAREHADADARAWRPVRQRELDAADNRLGARRILEGTSSHVLEIRRQNLRLAGARRCCEAPTRLSAEVRGDRRSHVADANELSDDATSMLTWWQGQDSTRIPRFDQASFSTAGCLDITFVRLSGTAASYTAAGASGAFQSIITELSRTANVYKDYLVYYDGPSVEANVCGVGGTRAFATGPSYAIVLLQGCAGVAEDLVATHELIHAFGAVPPGGAS